MTVFHDSGLTSLENPWLVYKKVKELDVKSLYFGGMLIMYSSRSGSFGFVGQIVAQF